MTIIEALRRSRETGESFSRDSRTGYSGWIAYYPGHLYRDLSYEDLTSDDWIPCSERIEKLTGGRWTTAEAIPFADKITTNTQGQT